jgi:DNA-binding LacI/PurR family transcriptional regulator
MAIGVMRELRDRGLRVPEDVSITGFDNIELSQYTDPALTTVNVPRARIGQLCFEALVRDESRPELPRNLSIDPELVVRGSTARPAVLSGGTSA